jgi:hypothetical protein
LTNECFELKISIDKLEYERKIKEVSSPNGITILSKSFDAARRSWHLKIDLDQNDSISIYLIERGLPLKNNDRKLENCAHPNFSSTLFNIEV